MMVLIYMLLHSFDIRIFSSRPDSSFCFCCFCLFPCFCPFSPVNRKKAATIIAAKVNHLLPAIASASPSINAHAAQNSGLFIFFSSAICQYLSNYTLNNSLCMSLRNPNSLHIQDPDCLLPQIQHHPHLTALSENQPANK